MKVLILTRQGDDECVGRVQAGLEELGHQGIRFDTDLYPAEARLSTSYSRGRRRRLLETASLEVDLDELGAVYFRRFEAGSRLPPDLGEFRRACYRESVHALQGVLASLDCFQLDPFLAIQRAEFKELQTKVALELGLECPRTLISNDPRAVAGFSHEVGEVVAKLQTKAVVHRQGEQQAVFTSLLGPQDYAEMEGLRYSPMVFQEKVDKARELRVTVVGDRLFPAAIDSSRSPVGGIDWRLDPELSFGWEPWELPEDVAARLVELVRRFGLNYSAADLILTPDGRYVFLEINSAGEWTWLARDLGLPIGPALARVLTDPSARIV